MRIAVSSIRDHPRGRIYDIRVEGKSVVLRLSFHALGRMALWQLTERRVFEALLFPEEVLRGHGGRLVAHRRYGSHLVRVVYEYESHVPVVITVYFPSASRYFQGGQSHEDRIFS